MYHDRSSSVARKTILSGGGIGNSYILSSPMSMGHIKLKHYDYYTRSVWPIPWFLETCALPTVLRDCCIN